MTPADRPVPDYAKRCAERINLHVFLGDYGRWAAIRLSDGGSDGTAYENRRDAIKHQLHESQCAYICIPREAMSGHDAMRFMDINRDLYDKGFRLTDPDDPRHFTVPTVDTVGVNPLTGRTIL